MNSDELRRLVAQGESETLEFKRTTGELTPGIRSACAILNGGRSGHVLFGVTDDGHCTGQQTAPNTLEEVANALRRIEPRADLRTEVIPVEADRAVIAVHVPYERIGNTTGPMPTATYQRRLVEQAEVTNPWESRPAEGLTVADLDQSEIVVTVEEAIRRQRLEEPGTRETEHLLIGLGLIREDRLLNAAMVLFGKEDRLRGRYPQALLRMARFRGTTKNAFIDNRQMIGNAFAMYGAAQRFWIDHLPVAGRIVPDRIERIDEPLYPTEALREALANAICHRDYTVPGDSIAVAIYDDRLEISSPGPLPFGLTPQDLLRPHPSRRRNPLIAEVFYRRGLIEQWGRGTLKMVELTREAGIPDPVFESTRHEVIVCFRHDRSPVLAQIGRDLPALQRELLTLLLTRGPLSLGQIMALLDTEIPERTVQNNLRALRDRGLALSSGGRRWARWSAGAGEPAVSPVSGSEA